MNCMTTPGHPSPRPPDVRSLRKISVLIDRQWHNQATGCMVDAGVLCLREDGAWFLIPHGHYERVTFHEQVEEEF